MTAGTNGKARWFGELVFKIIAVAFIIWQLNEHFVSTAVEARVGPLEQKVEMLEKQLDRIEDKLDRVLDRE